jgi:hypothetical protein
MLIFEIMKRDKSILKAKLPALISLLSIIFAGCNKYENIPSLPVNLAYYPLVLDAVNVYNVDSTVYDDFTNTTKQYQFKLKDSVTSTYLDGLGEEVYRIERYKKENSGNWKFQKVISRKIINNRAEEILDNKKYVRLVFPTKLYSSWNGNTYNDLDRWPHEVTRIDEPLTLSNLNLDSTLTVQQYEEINLIREDIYSEIYAKNIGLIVKEVKAIDKDISSGRTKKGYQYKMQLESHK